MIGNADAWLVPNHPVPVTPTTSNLLDDIIRWGRKQLTDADVEWLRDLPMTITVPMPHGTSLFGFHASPKSVEQVISATTPAPEFLDGEPLGAGSILANGHTHVQLLRQIDQGHLLNPGSVGLPGIGPGLPALPVNNQVNWAEFAVISVSGGATEIALRREPIALDDVLRAAARSGMPHVDWWRTLWAE